MDSFHNDEDGYLAWRESHQEGFVLNHFGGRNSAFNILHRSDCTFLWRDIDEGSRTAVEKWCSTSEDQLRQHADSVLGKEMWKLCGVCFREPRSRRWGTAAPVTVVTGATLASGAVREESLWIAGEPAVWLGSREKEWKHSVTSAFKAAPLSETPQSIDVEFRLLDKTLYRKDIDNLLTPILESARDGGWVERGFARLGSVTARKVVVADQSEVGAVVTPRANPPVLVSNRTGVLIEAILTGLDQDSVKWTLYERAFDLYQRRPDLRFPPQCSVSIDVRVAIDDAGRRKSIAALMKPCIDGLEPILGHPSNLPPEPRDTIQRPLAPQDEMVLSLAFHVRGETSNEVSVLISPQQICEPRI